MASNPKMRLIGVHQNIFVQNVASANKEQNAARYVRKVSIFCSVWAALVIRLYKKMRLSLLKRIPKMYSWLLMKKYWRWMGQLEKPWRCDNPYFFFKKKKKNLVPSVISSSSWYPVKATLLWAFVNQDPALKMWIQCPIGISTIYYLLAFKLQIRQNRIFFDHLPRQLLLGSRPFSNPQHIVFSYKTSSSIYNKLWRLLLHSQFVRLMW